MHSSTTIRKLLLTFVFSLYPAVALAAECFSLDITIEGALPLDGDTVVELPDDLVNAVDVATSLKVMAKDGAWDLILVTQSSGSLAEEKLGTLTRDEHQSKTVSYMYSFQPRSADSVASSSFLNVNLKNVFGDNGDKRLTITDLSKTSQACFRQGQLDEKGEVNGGVVSELMVGIDNVPGGYLYEPKPLN